MNYQYKVHQQQYNIVEESQLNLFGIEETIEKDEFVNIEYQHKGYNCNDNIDNFIDSKTQVISFFSGAGGFDVGAQLAGTKVISSLDFFKEGIMTMSSNKYFNHTKHFIKDIKEAKGSDYSEIIKNNNPEKLILLGGPPCQPFSKAGYWVTHENRLGGDDPRNMIGQYLRMIKELQPDGFVLENVESILHPRNLQTAKNLEIAIKELGYHSITFKANSADFGVPQKRKRVFFIASKKPIIGEPEKTHGTAKEILVNPNLKPHERVIDWIGKFDEAKYSDNYDSTEGKYYEDLKDVPPGQNYIALTAKRNYPNPKFIAGKRYWSFLLKLDPLKPSWTIIASPGHWEGPFHWSSRRLRLREAAGIQTFPDDYTFFGSRRVIRKQIGNAVPPLLGKHIVNFLKKQL